MAHRQAIDRLAPYAFLNGITPSLSIPQSRFSRSSRDCEKHSGRLSGSSKQSARPGAAEAWIAKVTSRSGACHSKYSRTSSISSSVAFNMIDSRDRLVASRLQRFAKASTIDDDAELSQSGGHRGMSALGQVTPLGNGSMSGSNGVENCRDTLQYERPLLRSGSPNPVVAAAPCRSP